MHAAATPRQVAFWNRMVRAPRLSGISRADFCARQEISPTQFRKWKYRRLKAVDPASRAARGPSRTRRSVGPGDRRHRFGIPSRRASIPDSGVQPSKGPDPRREDGTSSKRPRIRNLRCDGDEGRNRSGRAGPRRPRVRSRQRPEPRRLPPDKRATHGPASVPRLRDAGVEAPRLARPSGQSDAAAPTVGADPFLAARAGEEVVAKLLYRVQPAVRIQAQMGQECAGGPRKLGESAPRFPACSRRPAQ